MIVKHKHMLEVKAICRQLHSIQQKLTESLTSPPYTAGYVQQLIHLAIDLLVHLPKELSVPAEAPEKALQGLRSAQVLADRFDKMNATYVPMYEMADVLQPAIEALNRFLIACDYPE